MERQSKEKFDNNITRFWAELFFPEEKFNGSPNFWKYLKGPFKKYVTRLGERGRPKT